MKIVLVAAIGENNVIGRAGQLPWRLKSDLKHFRSVTIDKPVVMGRKTYESIGKPLKDRTNIVLTRDLSLNVPGGVLATSLDAALAIARQDAAKRGVDEIMVIGGSDVFAATMAMAEPAGDHPCACRARGGCTVSADRSDGLARGHAQGLCGRPGRRRQFHGSDLFKALKSNRTRQKAAFRRVVTTRRVPYNPSQQDQPASAGTGRDFNAME